MKTKRGRLWLELVGGLVAVILLSGLATFAGVLFLTRQDFDVLVEKNDVDIAQSYAAALARHFGRTGSWEGIGEVIQSRQLLPFRAPTPGDDKHADRDRSRGRDIPLILTDERGEPIFTGLTDRRDKDQRKKDRPEKLDVARGAAVEANGKVVGYVFFKSMIFRQYDPHEAAFIDGLAKSIGTSVLIGVLLSLVLGSLLAARFTRPLAVLDEAVKTIAAGDLKARVRIDRKDEIGSLAGNFNVMADRLEANERSRKNLIADVAHELRTPVSIIQANLEMILAGVYAADAERLQSLYDETRLLTRLIADLRSLSDLELGVVPVATEDVDLEPLLAEARDKFLPLYGGKGLGLGFDPAGKRTKVRADRERLRQVLRNLLENAYKHSPENSRVTLAAERLELDGKRMVRVAVSDEGPGVPEGDLERIFERFYRVDPSRNRESGGRGLGLAICRQVIEASGGTIAARNRQSGGLEVFFLLEESLPSSA